MFFQRGCKRLGEKFFYRGAHFRISQFRFGLPFKLRFRKFYRDDRGQSFARIFTAQVVVFFL